MLRTQIINQHYKLLPKPIQKMTMLDQLADIFTHTRTQTHTHFKHTHRHTHMMCPHTYAMHYNT